MVPNILVVEDDDNQRELVEKLLVDAGYSVRLAANGTAALKKIEEVEPDLVLLDLGLPDITGEAVFSQIRKTYPELPVVIVTARGTTSDIVEGFNLGADDYVTKPYNIDELLARVKARMKNAAVTDKMVVGDLELNTKTFEVTRRDKKIDLTPKEYNLLEYLIINKGQVLSRDMILSRVWQYSPDMETRAVDVYIGYLRKKIDSGFTKKLIQSVRGHGYIIRE